jgi:hypothetical protein
MMITHSKLLFKRKIESYLGVRVNFSVQLDLTIVNLLAVKTISGNVKGQKLYNMGT